MTIGSLTPVKQAGGRMGERKRRGVPICLRRESIHLYSAGSVINTGGSSNEYFHPLKIQYELYSSEHLMMMFSSEH